MSFDPKLENKFKGMFSRERARENITDTILDEKQPASSADDSDTPLPNPESSSKDSPAQGVEESSTANLKSKSSKYTEEQIKSSDKYLENCRKIGRHRLVYRWWPRDPDGPNFQHGPGGKMTSNGNHQWGATLENFFHTNRVPSIQNFVLATSSSRLASFVRKIGEKECKLCEDELKEADEEEEPKQLFPISVSSQLLYSKIQFEQHKGRSLPRSEETLDGDQADPATPFKLQNYPQPWPFAPFSSSLHPTLTSRLPLHLLPDKLMVHDPWNLLKVKRRSSSDTCDTLENWEDMPDIIRTYHLDLTPETREKRKKSRQAVVDDWEKTCSSKESLVFYLTSDPGDGPTLAPIVVFLPPRPRPIVEIPEAHLYISPTHLLGNGNHSCVYDVEWELPRTAFFEPQICMTCLQQAVNDFVKEEFKDKEFPRGTLERDKEPVPPNSPPDTQPKILDSSTYTGPAVHILPEQINLQYQHPGTSLGPCCEHLKGDLKYPLTGTVHVTAKLSIRGDSHLKREAENYQAFPDHLFEHWSGYNMISPMHDPFPVGAVVPQFYGYYSPDPQEVSNLKDDDDGEDYYYSDRNVKYLSPILLLENCGAPVDPDELGVSDSQECASLLYRFHSAGWLHKSVFARNVLEAKGSLFDPEKAQSPDIRRFRLIDFGRSSKFTVAEQDKDRVFFARMEGHGNRYDEEYTRMQEEGTVKMLFPKIFGMQ